MASQNPSPMEEHIRPHERVKASNCDGVRDEISGIFEEPISIFIPEFLTKGDTVNLVFHFHGSPQVVDYTPCPKQLKLAVFTINLGSGSSAYEKPLLNDQTFLELLKGAKKVVQQQGLVANQTILSGFSAGYGAVRAIISNSTFVNELDGILLLDGLHTDYQPEGKRLADGGKLNTQKLDPFLSFAQLAISEQKRFIFTHSSIFPGTYASTTECADYLINALQLKRIPVLEQGPLGMQLLGKTEKGGLKILAFAGNTAPDHIDHFHGMYTFINFLVN
jgi:hypothetical protein